ncbi:MAG: outer membrane beta-barrel protein [Thermodesulfobacteriota bacterium]
MKRIAAGFAVLLGAAAFTPVAMAGDVDTAFKINGFVDASYSDADSGDGTFSLDQVEIDVQKKINGKLGVRADINYLSTGVSTFDELVEQGYVTYDLAVGNGATFTFGKFNAPIGFELLDPVDMYQFSHSLVFDNGLPTNLTGVMGSYAFTDMFDASVYVVNGWDNNADNNAGKTVGGRLGITPVSGVNLGLSVISGTMETTATTGDRRTVFDADLTVTLVERLTVGAELNIGNEERASLAVSGEDAKWTSYLVMAHYDFTDWLGLTARYDYFDDRGGTRLGNSMREREKSYTVAPTVALGDGAGLLAEYRRDESSENVYGTVPDDTKDTFAVEFTYSF